LGGTQSIFELTRPGGRLYESRRAILDACDRSKYMTVVAPSGSMYAFIRVDDQKIHGFDDQEFALRLLERERVLIAPGSSFNVPYRNHFRITLLPDARQMSDVFGRIERVLAECAE